MLLHGTQLSSIWQQLTSSFVICTQQSRWPRWIIVSLSAAQLKRKPITLILLKAHQQPLMFLTPFRRILPVLISSDASSHSARHPLHLRHPSPIHSQSRRSMPKTILSSFIFSSCNYSFTNWLGKYACLNMCDASDKRNEISIIDWTCSWIAP